MEIGVETSFAPLMLVVDRTSMHVYVMIKRTLLEWAQPQDLEKKYRRPMSLREKLSPSFLIIEETNIE